MRLGEVRATQVIVTLVDGEQGHSNHKDTVDMVYLPNSFGFCPCYKHYMESLGYAVTCCQNGGVIVEGIGGKTVDANEFVGFTTYCQHWKKNYLQLKVSHPVEDICQYYFVFTNCHRYLANHSAMDLCVEYDEDGDEFNVFCCSEVDENKDNGQLLKAIPAKNNIAEGSASISIPSKSAANTVTTECEILLLECAIHVQMAHAQQSLYQVKIELSIADAKASVHHEKRIYMFVGNYDALFKPLF